VRLVPLRAALGIACAFALSIGAVCAAAGAESAPAAHPALRSTRALVAKLAKSGRGEAPVTVSRGDPLGGPDHVDEGRLALEPPDRMRLDFAATGERIALRGDGGEWVQPQARQMVRIRREQAGLATWLWEVFLEGGAEAFVEEPAGSTREGERRYTLEPRDREAGLPGRITIQIDSKGLPSEVRFTDTDGTEARYRFRGWSFRAARGGKAFTLSAPHGYAVVDLP
jgi:outer membrane lipoprotein-sorting protein